MAVSSRGDRLNPIETDEGTWVLSANRRHYRTQANEEERKRLEAEMQHSQKLESLGVLAGGLLTISITCW